MRLLQSIGCLAPAAIVMYGVAGVLLLTLFGGQTVDYLRTMGWQQTSGTIIANDIEELWDTTGDRFIGHVAYVYEVEGVVYEGNRLNLSGADSLRGLETAERLLAPYPVGASVMLYFDPSAPSNSVLNRDLPNAILVLVGTACLLVLLSVGLGVRHFMIRRTPHAPASA